ncbi:SPASM domain-containing protein, partial [Candidatus Aerophobetes bacterium]|nr:SPASM domain-containing protein [Candidatus Aerophobetes bacterium]
KIVSIDAQGNVHPCQFWRNVSLGNVRDEKLGRIWLNGENELLLKLREKERYLKGKCARCDFASLCGGCRVRAEAFYADMWEEDPACYLKEEEIRK